MKTHIKKISTLVIAVSLLAQTAHANFSIAPSPKNNSMKFSVIAGQEGTGYALLRNTGEEPINIKVYANDATKTAEGHFALKQAGEEQMGLGAWTTFSQESFEVEPRQNREVPFVMSVPGNIPPGVYAGGIAVEMADEEDVEVVEATGGTSVQINSRIIIPFFVDVPGDRVSEVEFSNLTFSKDPQNKDFFIIGVKNVGNTAIVLEPTIEISGFGGLYQEKLSAPELNLYIGEETNVRIKWEDKPVFGFFTATAKISYSENDIIQDKMTSIGEEVQNISVNIIPWLFILIIIIVIAAIAILLQGKKVQKKKLMASSKKYTVQVGDTLPSIAKKAGVNWEKLAELNNIEPPYELTPNQQLLIPPK